MKILILFDSLYGNTKGVASAIAEAFPSSDSVKTIQVNDVNNSDLKSIDLLIVGSPTQGGRPTPALLQFLKQLPADSLNNIDTTAFDTRFLEKDQNFALQLLMKTIGYAAPRIAGIMKSKGGKLISEPEGFIVKSKEGPLKQGELERAKEWAKTLKKKILQS